MLRGLLRRPGFHAGRACPRLESGLNDVVLLPIVLVGCSFSAQSNVYADDWARLGLDLFLLGPGAGIAVGCWRCRPQKIRAQNRSAPRLESIYSLGVCFHSLCVR